MPYIFVDNNQPISDILLYYSHVDPQIQGVVAQVIGNLLHAVIHCHTDCHYEFNSESQSNQQGIVCPSTCVASIRISASIIPISVLIG